MTFDDFLEHPSSSSSKSIASAKKPELETLYNELRVFAGLSDSEGAENDPFIRAINYETGQGGLNENPLKAFKLYKELVRDGHVAAHHRLGMMYLEGRGVDPDPREGISLLLLACDSNCAEAQYQISQFYRNGEYGYAKDRQRACKFLYLAAAHGHEVAQQEFANILNELDLGDPSFNGYVKDALTLVTTAYPHEGVSATHASWNNPNLLWKLYAEKAQPSVFAFLQRRLPDLFERSRDDNSKTILHRILEDWSVDYDHWYREVFEVASRGITDTGIDIEICDNFGRSFLDVIFGGVNVSARHLLIGPFRRLVEKGAGNP